MNPEAFQNAGLLLFYLQKSEFNHIKLDYRKESKSFCYSIYHKEQRKCYYVSEHELQYIRTFLIEYVAKDILNNWNRVYKE